MVDNYSEEDESFINSFSKKKNDCFFYDEKSIIPIEIFNNIFSDKFNEEFLDVIGDKEEEKIINKDKINNKNEIKENKENNHIQIIINNNQNSWNFFSSSSSPNSKNKTERKNKHKKKILKNINDMGILRLTSNKVALGRKKKDIIREIVGHDKFSDDNLIRKIKCTLIDLLSSLINKLLKKYYNGNIGEKENKIELLKMNQNQIVSSKADYNRNFIAKTLKEIFSYRISTKYLKYDPGHNKNIINKILNEKKRDIKIKFENIFNLTFLDCLEHFRGTKYIKDLEGMTNLDEFCNKFENDPDYISKFKLFVNNFENILFSKKMRNREKKYKSIETNN